MRIRPLIVALAAVAAFGIAGCGDDNGGNDNNDNTGGGTRTSTPARTPTSVATTGAATPTTATTSSAAGTPVPTATGGGGGGGAGVCEGTKLNVTVTSDAGSDLDTGWTGIAHNSIATQDTSVTTELDCTSDSKCTVNGANLVNQPFGSPLPLSSGGVPVCVLNTFREAVTGTYDCSTGCSETNVKILSKVFLVQDIAQPCPICVGDTTPNDGQKNGTCQGGTAAAGQPCDTGGTSPQFGSTSNDCLPTGNSVGELNIDITPLTTGTISQTGTTQCVAASAGSNCFCPSQNRGNACDSGVCTNGTCPEGPIDAFCSVQKFRSCLTNDDCETTFPGSGTCVQQARPCFTDTISRTGQCGTQSGTLVGFFCIPQTRAPAINTTAGLPGPGALSLPAHQVRVVAP